MPDVLDQAVSAHARMRAKQVIGGHCLFVDDDIDLLALLADRAIQSGLTHGLAQSILESIASREGLPL